MAFVALLDANVLYPAQLRDLLMSQALTGVYQAKWSPQILDEVFRAIKRQRPDLEDRRLRRTRELMCRAVPDCLVSGHEKLIPALQLPDVDDRHVLAAAIVSGAQVIVTHNLKDFPATVLAPYGIEAKGPDLFLVETMELNPGRFLAAVVEMAARLRHPPKSVHELIDDFERTRLPRLAARLRDAFNA
jgi:predicted nucleic acid-binding protein